MIDFLIVMLPVLVGLVILCAMQDQRAQDTQEPTQPPDRVVMYKTQAVRKSALYGTPDVNQRPLEKMEERT